MPDVLLIGHDDTGPTAMIAHIPMHADVVYYAYTRPQLRLLELIGHITRDRTTDIPATRIFKRRDDCVYEEVFF